MGSKNKKQNKKIFLAIIFFSFLVLARSAEAKDLYVDVQSLGGSCSDATSYDNNDADNPFCSIQKAADVVNPGDIVIVKDGVYTDTNGDDAVLIITRSGEPDRWITFKSEKIGGAKIDGMNNTTDFGVHIGLKSPVLEVSFVRLEGFEITGLRWHGILANYTSHDIYYYKNHIHHIGRVCEVYMSGGQRYAPCTGKAGFGSEGTTYNITYDSNIIHDIGRLGPPDGCIHINPDGTNPALCSEPPNGPNPNMWNSNDHCMYIMGNLATVKNNVFYGCDRGWAISNNNYQTTHHWTIINNTFAHANPYRSNTYISVDHPAEHWLIRNNIFYDPPGNPPYGSGVWTGWESTANDVEFVIDHNLVYGTGDTIAGPEQACGSTWTCSDNLIETDPLFMDYAGKDFRLRSGSLAIGRGSTIESPSVDIEGNLRDSLPDIGAYEYVLSADIQAPNAPSGLSVN